MTWAGMSVEYGEDGLLLFPANLDAFYHFLKTGRVDHPEAVQVSCQTQYIDWMVLEIQTPTTIVNLQFTITNEDNTLTGLLRS